GAEYARRSSAVNRDCANRWYAARRPDPPRIPPKRAVNAAWQNCAVMTSASRAAAPMLFVIVQPARRPRERPRAQHRGTPRRANRNPADGRTVEIALLRDHGHGDAPRDSRDHL